MTRPEDARAAVIVRQMFVYVDMMRAIGPQVDTGNRKAQNIVKRLRRHMARLDLDAGREYARRQGIALPPEVEELYK